MIMTLVSDFQTRQLISIMIFVHLKTKVFAPKKSVKLKANKYMEFKGVQIVLMIDL